MFDYPIEVSPLAKISRDGNKNIVEMIEGYNNIVKQIFIRLKTIK